MIELALFINLINFCDCDFNVDVVADANVYSYSNLNIKSINYRLYFYVIK